MAEWAPTTLNGRAADVTDRLAAAGDPRHEPEDRKKFGETVTYQ